MKAVEGLIGEAAVGRALLFAGLVLLACVAPAQASASGNSANAQREEAKVLTDGRLRPGHFETIRVKGFPGKGRTEVNFFPTAICGSECGANARQGTMTDGKGGAKFRVRMPGTFFDHSNRHACFRDGEQIEVNVLWYGPDKTFDVATTYPDPILVRTHRHRND